MIKTFKYLILFFMFSILFAACKSNNNQPLVEKVLENEKERISKLVDSYWDLEPITVTDTSCVRSVGGIHDFYSEGDYWWPDPENENAPYIQRDGLSNPNNFLSHRRAMVRLSRIVGAMTSSYIISNEDKYAQKAMEHIRAWFVSEETKMNPHLLYSQAIKGRHTGRGIGVIDGLHLIEVARSISLIQDAKGISKSDIEISKIWFADFLEWMYTHEYGKSEMIHPNNHGTCWAMQAAAYAQLTENDSILEFCIDRFKDVLLPEQMAENGSFPLELKRTKPYGYSLFNLDAMSLLAQILTLSGDENMWNYTTSNAREMKKGLEFLYPFMKDKSTWPYKKDVLYWDEWPVCQASLVLGGIAYANSDYIDLWIKLKHDPEVEEVQRNLVMRYPLLWIKN